MLEEEYQQQEQQKQQKEVNIEYIGSTGIAIVQTTPGFRWEFVEVRRLP